jgi:hypothetical protein
METPFSVFTYSPPALLLLADHLAPRIVVVC